MEKTIWLNYEPSMTNAAGKVVKPIYEQREEWLSDHPDYEEVYLIPLASRYPAIGSEDALLIVQRRIGGG